MSALLERRNTAKTVEFREDSAGGEGTLYGYAATYMRYSQNLGGFVEQVAPGAFAKSLGDKVPVMARYNHEDEWLLGTTEAATLRLVDDTTGLAYEVALPSTNAGKDVAILARRGDIRYSSFAFYTPEGGDEWGVTEQGFPLRTLLNVRLVDIAPVNSPAYLDTSAGVRSLAARIGVEVDTLEVATTAEIRSLLLGEPIDIPAVEARSEEQKETETEQGDTHSTVTLRQREIELLKLR
jgi:HK97 family phage prohead protease